MSETQSGKSWYQILASLTPLIVGICVTGVGTFYTYQNNQQQLQLNKISALDKFRTLLTSENESEREFAYASFAALGYEELAFKIIKTKRDTAGNSVVQAAVPTPERKEAADALASIPARIYLHIADESQRPTATTLAGALRRMGYSVPGIERVAAVPKNTSVRYFNGQDGTLAEDVSKALRANAVTDATPQEIKGFKVRPGSIEVWLSAGFR